MYKYSPFVCLLLLFQSCTTNEYTEVADAGQEVKKQQIAMGQKLFAETKLSAPEGQSCMNCHDPANGFSDPQHRAVTPGVHADLFGNRNAPALAYNALAPIRTFSVADNTYVGGLFWDGRAQDLEAQAVGPLFNPVEMSNTSVSSLAQKIKNLSYYNELLALYGPFDNDQSLVSAVGRALATFQRSAVVNSFTSKFDYVQRGLASFTADEQKGLALYQGKGKCAQCHVLEEDERTGKILFTDFSYDNLGVPANASNPFYLMPPSVNPLGTQYVDFGLGEVTNEAAQRGKFKVPTLRNIAVSAPYFHNGGMATLEEVIHFYNKRDVEPLGVPEVPQNVNRTELGNLNLTQTEEFQLKKFLETLTDHYRK
ncbi:MAG: cytochrome B6 [Flavobacterium sp. BFFFF2]|nr:MAG: cytochrome B6 [Flavobacterium sp. BFFFF2]